MTKKKAIEILRKQISKLDDIYIYKDEKWVFQTGSYLKDFFGEDSPEYSFISQFTFSVIHLSYNTNEEVLISLNNKKRKAKSFLEDCIETIENKGLLKEKNLLYRLSDTAIWAIIGLSIPGLLTLGAIYGNLNSDKQNIYLKQENKTLKDSLKILKPFYLPKIKNTKR